MVYSEDLDVLVFVFGRIMCEVGRIVLFFGEERMFCVRSVFIWDGYFLEMRRDIVLDLCILCEMENFILMFVVGWGSDWFLLFNFLGVYFFFFLGILVCRVLIV